eukprot:1143934-Pelagomonas_calceolata.AAC.4
MACIQVLEDEAGCMSLLATEALTAMDKRGIAAEVLAGTQSLNGQGKPTAWPGPRTRLIALQDLSKAPSCSACLTTLTCFLLSCCSQGRMSCCAKLMCV